ncbi:hypothetical protein BX616_006443 [Lobosporangium transversale]|nr:hypothetical protein BX616_006443 [Lobosporangium transversale]
MSGASSSSLAAILGGVVGAIVLFSLIALAFYRHHERKRARMEYMNVGTSDGSFHPEMEEGPRTAFRHESFMALVQDAAKGFYAPTMDMDPAGPSGTSGAAGAGAGAGVGPYNAYYPSGGLGHQGEQPSYGQAVPYKGNRRSESGQSLQYLEIGSGSPSSPPNAHVQPPYRYD